ncbi:MAG: hypothetical protein Q9208_006599 [Pyrenodesmia sp. 3 TL-2023]
MFKESEEVTGYNARESPYRSFTDPPSPAPLQRRKRAREVESPADHNSVEVCPKRPRPLPAASFLEQTAGQEEVNGISASQRSYIGHWAEKRHWPEGYFRQNVMDRLLARKKSTAALRRKRSVEDTSTTSGASSEQMPREEKSAPYRNPSYRILLEAQGDSYMGEYELGINSESEEICRKLLERTQPTPTNTLFGDDVFRNTCNRLHGKNEARIKKDLLPLIVPSAEPLATFGAEHLNIVAESVDEGWNNCIPVTRPRPQPDYAIGFARSAFSESQLSNLRPCIGDPSDLSFFMATYYMHFPFLTAEVKCGTTGLDIADRQNAHSMTIAVRAVVELFRAVGRQQEVHRRILAFSFSHDHESVRIWGHYPVIAGDKTTYWRYPIRKFDFTERSGAEKWVAYTFTKNVYDHWVAPHFRWICSAIDDLSHVEKETSAQSEPLLSEPSGLSQQLQDQNFAYETEQHGPITPDTSTQTVARKKKKK